VILGGNTTPLVRSMERKFVLFVIMCAIALMAVFLEFWVFRNPVYSSSAKIVSVVKEEGHFSGGHFYDFTVQVLNNGTDPLNNATVVIRLYHDPMEIFFPVTKYTNEVQDYGWKGNVLQYGIIPAGGNETQSTFIVVGDLYKTGGGEVFPVPVNYSVITCFLGNNTLDEQTQQFDLSMFGQTWTYS
jgi:hypothetical protein